MNKSIFFKNDMFWKYVVCLKCYVFYDFVECVNVIEGDEMFKKCINVLFLNYVFWYFWKFCGEFFLKLVIVNGKKKFVLRKSFCYKSIEESL